MIYNFVVFKIKFKNFYRAGKKKKNVYNIIFFKNLFGFSLIQNGKSTNQSFDMYLIVTDVKFSFKYLFMYLSIVIRSSIAYRNNK